MTRTETDQPPPEIAATIVATRALGPQVALIRLRAPAPLSWRPGQVVELRAPRGIGTGLFAIASAPREGPELALLVKAAGGVSSWLTRARPGEPVAMSAPLGEGFPVGEGAGRDLLLIGVGTAIAPLRAALVWALGQRGRGGRLTLLQGARTPAELWFLTEHASWRAAGVALRCVVSQPHSKDGWSGRRGHVQEHMADLVTPDSLVFVAGMPAMERETREALYRLGLPPAQIHDNHS